jgi:hypothetical protein
MRSSTSVFQASHAGHCPRHWAEVEPHCEHTWKVERAIVAAYAPQGTGAWGMYENGSHARVRAHARGSVIR